MKDGKTERRTLLACAKAIRALEMPFNTVIQNPIMANDHRDYMAAKRLLWDVL